MTIPLLLPHRAVVEISGPDAGSFLQGLLTQSVTDIPPAELRHAALLSPQGKVLLDLYLSRTDDLYLADVDRAAAPDLLQRLQRYKLRADVRLVERPDLAVLAFAGAPDPRSPAAPHRLIAPAVSAPPPADLETYHAARIAAGLAEMGADFAAGEVFPADINMDQEGGVDFRKGCFVGQEVVSRMKRRGHARRRTLVVDLAAPAPLLLPAPVTAAGEDIGLLTSQAAGQGLARLRVDRLVLAQAAGAGITAAGTPLVCQVPDWMTAGQAGGAAAD